jgi:hypothetical protein
VAYRAASKPELIHIMKFNKALIVASLTAFAIAAPACDDKKDAKADDKKVDENKDEKKDEAAKDEADKK